MAQVESTTFNAPGPIPSDEEIAEALELELEEQRIAEEVAKIARQDVLDEAARAVTAKYTARKSRRGAKEQQWLVASRLRLSNLAATSGFSSNPDQPFEGSGRRQRPERNIVGVKIDIAKAQLYSLQFSGGEKNYDFLPPDNRQELEAMGLTDIGERCEKMENTISSQLEECYFEREALAAMDEWTHLGTGVLKGPVNSGKMYHTYMPSAGQDGKTTWTPKVSVNPKPYLKHVSVWMLYPDDSVNDFNQSEDMIEVHPYSAFELKDLTKNPGFLPDQIEKAMEIGPGKMVAESYADFSTVTDSNPSVFRDKYTVLEYHGPITRDQLNKLSLEPAYEMPHDKYFGEIWVVNGKCIRFELSNIEGCNKPPYSAACWIKDPASPFGFGIALTLRDSQRVVNQSWHMILDNCSASSAPQVVINEDSISPSEGDYTIEPGKVWLHNEPMGNVQEAFKYFITPNVTGDIFPVLEAARQAAEEESGIAMIAAGLQSPEVSTDTATGMAIQRRASTVLIEIKSNDWDEHVMEPRLRGMYDWNMQYNPDDTIKCPMNLRIRSASDYRTKQEYIRDMEKLSLEAAQNELMGEWVNPDELIKTRLSMMHIPTAAIVKSVEQVNMEREAKAQQPAPPTPEEVKLQIEQARIELERERLAIEREKMQFELQQGQRREEMEYEERTLNTYARITEAETELARSQNDKEIAILQLVAKSENEAERSRVMAEVGIMSEETKRILGGLNHTAKIRDQLLTREELKLAKATGEGI